ncbi:extracellular solute-binding protein [Atopobacter sp. AH10]|uniref:LacI family DNA-binding transcriptional regulator n=1 Tax=Atopobacter sp. AH10 TaxID=2315861 RepID=UPI000EF24F53|nr:LacI family DNA-binding transcriptional regulator [Atopobacter sp. AH10]RLK63508.1 extracellular solute-binding protein [Atopobacter sp. AH10]
MRGATIADIAKASGVSIGTVSNVLNKKGNVKISTIRKVEQAVKELGYIKNNTAQTMKANESNEIIFLIHHLSSCLEPLITDLLHHLEQQSLILKVIEIDNLFDLSDLRNLLKSGQYKALITTTHTSEELLQLVPQSKLLVIGESQYGQSLAFDATELTEQISKNERYYILDDSSGFNISNALMQNFKDKDQLICLTKAQLTNIFPLKSTDNFIVCSESDLEDLLLSAKIHSSPLGSIWLISSKEQKYCYDSLVSHHFYFSSNAIASNIDHYLSATKLSSTEAKTFPKSIPIYSTNSLTVRPLAKETQLRILLLDNPFAKVLRQLVSCCYSETNIHLDLTCMNFQDLNQTLESNSSKDYDLIRLDVSYFPWYGSQLFRPLDQLEDLTILRNSLNFDPRYCSVQDHFLALPVDPSVQLMMYREDIFNDPVIQKAYLDSYNKKLSPPSSYFDLLEFCRFFHQLHIPEKTTAYPLAITSQTAILLASEFLPYYFSEGGEISYKEGEFILSRSTFLKVLNCYREISSYAKKLNSSWWSDEIKAYNAGESSLIIGYSNHLNQIRNKNSLYTSIPGNCPAFGGGVMGISQASPKISEAVLFFKWLYQYRTQEFLANSGVCVPRTHLYQERSIQRNYPFLAFSKNHFMNSQRLQYQDKHYIFHTIAIEKIIGQAILLGLSYQSSSEHIYQDILSQLKQHKETLVYQF